MLSDRLIFMHNPIRNLLIALLVTLLLTPLMSGCSSKKSRGTPETERETPWFCQMNESRDDWDCVQDAALVKNPKPQRLPSDPVEANPFDLDEPLTRTDTAGLIEAANPSAAIDFELAQAAIERGETVSLFLTLPPDQFTVQLTTTESRPFANRFVRDRGLEDHEDLIVLELAEDGKFYYAVLLGTYEVLEDAESAINARPESLADIKPWVRTLEPIQTGIRTAEAIRSRQGG